jgi:hypothetical protein
MLAEAVAALAAVGGARDATASLIGDEVRYERLVLGTTSGPVHIARIGPGIEFADGSAFNIPLDMDFDANTLTLTKPAFNVGFSGVTLHFFDLDWLVPGGEIISVDVAISNVLGTTPTVSFGPHELFVDVDGSLWNALTDSSMVITFNAIPAPGGMGPLAAGLTAAFLLRRRAGA